MKKIIDGKTYSTETATCLGKYTEFYGDDYKPVLEYLYRTRKGAYFVLIENDLLYQDTVNEEKSNPDYQVILPLAEDGAKNWVINHLSIDDYIEIFGEPEEA